MAKDGEDGEDVTGVAIADDVIADDVIADSAIVDVVIIGGGIAGVSAGYFLAEAGLSVTLLEAEATLAFHTTGRSAAQYVLNYGAPPVRALTLASRSFFFDPPPGLVDHPLLSRRDILAVARADQALRARRLYEQGRATGADVHLIGPDALIAEFPLLRPENAVAGMVERGGYDIDVAGLHQAFVRGMRRAGASIVTGAKVSAILGCAEQGWRVRAGGASFTARALVNAAGAWGDAIAVISGVRPVGLSPKRRTAFMVPGRADAASWSMLLDVDERWYLKPDGEQFLCSLAEETPSEPCDARPEEADVALAIERINAATTIGIRTVRSAWAGLRTFAPDRVLVIGEDPRAPGFYWNVGQGGVGIQTAPAAGALVAAAVTGRRPELLGRDFDATPFSPARFS